MTVKQLTDGMVMDRVAEFLYYPSSRLRDVYQADRVGYVDALCKFIQILATTDRMAISSKPPNEEMGQLKEELGSVVDETAFSFAAGVHERRSEGLQWITENWESIDGTVLEDRFSAKALNGHVQREFYRCFLVPENKRQSMGHYVSSSEALPLHPSNMNLLRVDLLPMAASVPEMSKGRILESWIQRTVTTHFRVFAEYGLFYRHQYAPSGTRSQIPILQKVPEEEALETVTRCLAADILENLVDSGRRSDLVKEVLRWRARRQAETVRRGYLDLVDKFEFLPKSGRQELISEINGILDAEKGFTLDLSMGSASSLLRSMGDIGSGSSKVKKVPRALRWLYSVRRAHVAHELFSLVDDLVRKG